MRAWGLCVVGLLLVACASAGTPLLRLSPAALQRTLALQQQLVVQAGGRTERVEVLLEADASEVKLALLSLGQVAARLEWDGQSLRQSQASWWPKAVSGERVLSDLQFVLWPADAVRQALPTPWTLEATERERVLRRGDEVVMRISYPSPLRAELEHVREGYRLSIESRPAEGEAS
jgi:hypothetical protein